MAQPPTSEPADGQDPAMEDILASIRRILTEEEKGQKDDVLMLDESMMVPEPAEVAPAPPPPAPPSPPPVASPPPAPLPAASTTAASPVAARTTAQPTPAPERPRMSDTPPSGASPVPTGPSTLVAPEAAAAAASSVGTLMRTLAAERGAVVRSGGPTIEDIVREEMRPMLKAWLDQHLPSTVERLVRAEIERVVGRMTP